ncbi:hypothetical protein AAVH_16645 [Aphelenchoides avenae]|nr:hypothetical protein AAVH_16645 [Aphelenchus avenae]
MPGIETIFEAAPALKCAEEVVLHSPRVSSTGVNSGALTSNFAVMKSLRIWFDYDTFRQFNWTFLRQESSHRLQRIGVYTTSSVWTENDLNRAVEELVRDCATLPRPLRGQPLELDFSSNKISRVLVLRILELLKDSTLELTFRTTLVDGGEFVLDKSEYTIDVNGSTTRYASQKSGIVVDVTGHAISIQSIVQVPCKKLRTAEEHR